MSNLVRAVEAAGLYIESHSGSKTPVATTLYCTMCNKDLLAIPAGDMVFNQTHGQCTCSWSCCAAARPGNKPHARHLSHRS